MIPCLKYCIAFLNVNSLTPALLFVGLINPNVGMVPWIFHTADNITAFSTTDFQCHGITHSMPNYLHATKLICMQREMHILFMFAFDTCLWYVFIYLFIYNVKGRIATP